MSAKEAKDAKKTNQDMGFSLEPLNKPHLASLRAFKPLAARPKAVAGSNPAS
jgi:hypothetical protein